MISAKLSISEASVAQTRQPVSPLSLPTMCVLLASVLQACRGAQLGGKEGVS